MVKSLYCPETACFAYHEALFDQWNADGKCEISGFCHRHPNSLKQSDVEGFAVSQKNTVYASRKIGLHAHLAAVCNIACTKSQLRARNCVHTSLISRDAIRMSQYIMFRGLYRGSRCSAKNIGCRAISKNYRYIDSTTQDDVCSESQPPNTCAWWRVASLTP